MILGTDFVLFVKEEPKCNTYIMEPTGQFVGQKDTPWMDGANKSSNAGVHNSCNPGRGPANGIYITAGTTTGGSYKFKTIKVQQTIHLSNILESD